MTASMDERTERPAERAPKRRPAEPDKPGFLTMIGFVAVFVATWVLVFFAVGYVVGRVFL